MNDITIFYTYSENWRGTEGKLKLPAIPIKGDEIEVDNCPKCEEFIILEVLKRRWSESENYCVLLVKKKCGC